MSSKKIVEPVDRSELKNRGWPKGKRRYPKGIGAPKQPLSGYVHFLNERRESVRSENPDITFSELSKKLAAEWSKLGDEEKNKYNEFARKDKDRYDREFLDYQNTEAYKQYIESQQGGGGAESGGVAAKKKKKKSGTAPSSARPSFEESEGEDPPMVTGSSSSSATFDIPIFTDEFMEHNKVRENELRQLRKQTTEFDEQNAVLSKHIDSMKTAISKLEMETLQQRQNNASQNQHLESIRFLVLQAFKGVQVPGFTDGLSTRNVDEMVTKLLSIVTDNPTQHPALIQAARDVVARIDYTKFTC